MTRIILIRHGESVANEANAFAGYYYDAELTQRGIEQAEKTAEYIFRNYKVDKAYASDLKRAYMTGKATADKFGIGVEGRSQLREIDAGKWDEMDFDEISRVYPEEFDVWMKDPGRACCPDGESVAGLGERVMAELNRIADENDGLTVAVACHATPIRCIITLVRHGRIEGMSEVGWVPNASVTVVEKNEGRWTVVTEGYNEHLGSMSTTLPDTI